jgi:hypothetical protein
MITLAKEPTLSNKRLAFDRLRNRDIVAKLFNELGPRYQTRPGGYTRILKMGFRAATTRRWRWSNWWTVPRPRTPKAPTRPRRIRI